MSKLPTLKPREIQKILLKNGFVIKRQTGSHRVFYQPESDKIAVIPFHSRDIPRGTLKSIIKQSGLLESDFRKN